MRAVGVIIVLALVFPLAAIAQDSEPTVVYAYVTYFDCDPARETRADEIIKRSYQPHYDAAVEHKQILRWSWLAHFVGGTWRRALVLSAANIDDLLDSSGALGEIIEETTPETGRVFTEVCGGHEDYIWQATSGVDGMTAADTRGKAGYSMYLRCDMSREAEADEIVRKSFAPLYNRYVESGQIVSWVWMQHFIGGEYRRLLAMTGTDHKALLKARASMIAELDDRKLKRAMDDFNRICPTHTDYLWDLQIETP